ARVVGAEFARLDGSVAVDALAQGDLGDLELEEPLVVVPAVCLPCDAAGSLASVDYVSVALRSALGEEMPADVACMKSCAEIEFFDSACAAAQPDVLLLADLGPRPDDWNIGALLPSVAFPAHAPGAARGASAPSSPSMARSTGEVAADEQGGEGVGDDEVDAARKEAAAQ
ncbi:unnamed protein product, partial [Prorocentrum cordatum]